MLLSFVVCDLRDEGGAIVIELLLVFGLGGGDGGNSNNATDGSRWSYSPHAAEPAAIFKREWNGMN